MIRNLLLLLFVSMTPVLTAHAESVISLKSLNRFEDGFDVIIDKATNLTWKTCSAGQERIKGKGCQGTVTLINFENAKKLQDSIWRLPTKEELVTLISDLRNENKTTPRIEGEYFYVDENKLNYWTATPVDQAKAWGVNFGRGPVAFEEDKNKLLAVRLVNGVFSLPKPTIKPPKDVYDFLGRKEGCEHFAGEPEYSNERRKEIENALDEMRCNSLDADEKNLRKKYRNKPDVMRFLNENN